MWKFGTNGAKSEEVIAKKQGLTGSEIHSSIQTHGQVGKKSYFDIGHIWQLYCWLRLIWGLDHRNRSRSRQSRYILPGAGAGAAEQFYLEPEPEPDCFPGDGAGAGADQKCHGSASLAKRHVCPSTSLDGGADCPLGSPASAATAKELILSVSSLNYLIANYQWQLFVLCRINQFCYIVPCLISVCLSLFILFCPITRQHTTRPEVVIKLKGGWWWPHLVWSDPNSQLTTWDAKWTEISQCSPQ